ncbi:transposase [Amycolatopsis sp. NPDC051061]|uniref:transposase n=1 Tax=Amycolatopsis sp. NPDC051061 TaxID=3155042 RepID=UPI003448BF29
MPRSSKYPEQFRKDAVELVRTSQRPLRQVARDLGVNHETLRNWGQDRREAGRATDRRVGRRRSRRVAGTA